MNRRSRQRIWDTLRREGLAVVMWRAIRRGAAVLGDLRLLTFYEKDLDKPLPGVTARVPVTIGPATEADIDQITALVVAWKRPEAAHLAEEVRRVRRIIADRAGRGNTCFIARANGELVHCNWLIFDSMEWPEGTGRRTTLPAGEAYTTDAITAEDWRGKAIHTVVLKAMLQHLRDRGYRKAYAQMRTDNRSAWKSHERLGWRRMATLLLFRPGGGNVTWVWRLRGHLPLLGPSRRFLALRREAGTQGEALTQSQMPR